MARHIHGATVVVFPNIKLAAAEGEQSLSRGHADSVGFVLVHGLILNHFYIGLSLVEPTYSGICEGPIVKKHGMPGICCETCIGRLDGPLMIVKVRGKQG